MDQSHLDWEQHVAKQRATLPFLSVLWKGCPHWGCYKLDNRSIPCCPTTFLSTSRKTKNHLLRQWYQLPRCIKWTSWNLQHASFLITDGEGTGFLDQRRMWLEIHPTTCSALRRIMESSCQIHEVPSATNIRFSHCHLWGIFNIPCRDRGLSKLQSLVCSIRWSL